MRLQLHNIGPIRDATVVVEPLTVLIGPNGSGKTTVSTVAYAAAQANLTARRSAGWSFLRRATRLGDRREVIDLAERLVANWEDEFRAAFQQQLQHCFGPNLLRLGRERRAGKGAAPRIMVSSGSKPGVGWQLVFRIQKDGLVLERSSKQYRPPKIPREIPNEKPRPTSQSAYERQLRRVLQAGMPSDAVYLPAARSGLMQMHATLTGLMLSVIGAGNLNQTSVGRVPGVAIDFVQFLAGLDPEGEPPEDEGDTAEYLEKSVVQGAVSLEIESGSRVVRFTPNGLEGAIDIEFAATSAAELAPLVLYLRHGMGAGDAVFIDEPEAHFHPEGQVALAEGLLRIASDVRSVVIATHSEFLVSGISNALLAAADHNGGAAARPPVHIYEFVCDMSDRTRGFEVVHHEVDPDRGFDVRQFSSVAERTFEEGIALYNDLHASKPAST